jgi:large subunit ribosomal protein L28
MSVKCDICGKTPQRGHNVSHATNRTKRVFKPNLQRVRAVVDGRNQHISVCTACIRSNRVVKAARVPRSEQQAVTVD